MSCPLRCSRCHPRDGRHSLSCCQGRICYGVDDSWAISSYRERRRYRDEFRYYTKTNTWYDESYTISVPDEEVVKAEEPEVVKAEEPEVVERPPMKKPRVEHIKADEAKEEEHVREPRK